MPARSMTRALVAALFTGAAWPAAGSWQVGISTTDPTDGGANFTEPGGGYARVTVASDTAHWALEASPSDFVANAQAITGFQSTAGYTALAWGLFVPAAVTPWATALLPIAVSVPANTALTLGVGAVGFDGGGT